jgi:hypothetical protein
MAKIPTVNLGATGQVGGRSPLAGISSNKTLTSPVLQTTQATAASFGGAQQGNLDIANSIGSAMNTFGNIVIKQQVKKENNEMLSLKNQINDDYFAFQKEQELNPSDDPLNDHSLFIQEQNEKYGSFIDGKSERYQAEINGHLKTKSTDFSMKGLKAQVVVNKEKEFSTISESVNSLEALAKDVLTAGELRTAASDSFDAVMGSGLTPLQKDAKNNQILDSYRTFLTDKSFSKESTAYVQDLLGDRLNQDLQNIPEEVLNDDRFMAQLSANHDRLMADKNKSDRESFRTIATNSVVAAKTKGIIPADETITTMAEAANVSPEALRKDILYGAKGFSISSEAGKGLSINEVDAIIAEGLSDPSLDVDQAKKLQLTSEMNTFRNALIKERDENPAQYVLRDGALANEKQEAFKSGEPEQINAFYTNSAKRQIELGKNVNNINPFTKAEMLQYQNDLTIGTDEEFQRTAALFNSFNSTNRNSAIAQFRRTAMEGMGSKKQVASALLDNMNNPQFESLLQARGVDLGQIKSAGLEVKDLREDLQGSSDWNDWVDAQMVTGDFANIEGYAELIIRDSALNGGDIDLSVAKVLQPSSVFKDSDGNSQSMPSVMETFNEKGEEVLKLVTEDDTDDIDFGLDAMKNFIPPEVLNMEMFDDKQLDTPMFKDETASRNTLKKVIGNSVWRRKENTWVLHGVDAKDGQEKPIELKGVDGNPVNIEMMDYEAQKLGQLFQEWDDNNSSGLDAAFDSMVNIFSNQHIIRQMAADAFGLGTRFVPKTDADLKAEMRKVLNIQ